VTSFLSGLLLITLTNLAPIQTSDQSFVSGFSEFSEGNYEKSIAIWERLALQGEPRAQYAIGVCYELGQGVDQSYALAVLWYQQATQQGFAMAKNNLGMLYEEGLGVQKSLKKAKSLYEEAAQQDLPSAQYNLALMYYQGQGTKQNFEQASHWLQRSASQGFAFAQYNLGVLYQNGQGVEQDFAQAAKWYIEAIKWGAPKAATTLKQLLEDKLLEIANTKVTVHTQPNTTADVVTQLTAGETVYALKEIDGWIAILLHDEKTIGWIEY